MSSNLPDVRGLVIICAVLIGGVIVFFVAALWVRKWFLSQQQSQPDMEFSLGQIDELYQRGELSEQEYKQIKAKTAQKAADRLLKKGNEGASKNQDKGPGKQANK